MKPCKILSTHLQQNHNLGIKLFLGTCNNTINQNNHNCSIKNETKLSAVSIPKI